VLKFYYSIPIVTNMTAL